MIRFIPVLAVLLIATPALAQEPIGCDKFKWPLDRERALLSDTSVKSVATGDTVDPAVTVAVKIKLVSLGDAKLPQLPERTSKSPAAFAGFVRMTALKKAGTYKITLSAPAWIDVVQGNHTVKSGAFSGVQGCAGIRKSVKFDLAAAPLIVQVNGVPADTIVLTITPAND
jgi:hypothetical protein